VIKTTTAPCFGAQLELFLAARDIVDAAGDAEVNQVAGGECPRASVTDQVTDLEALTDAMTAELNWLTGPW
jgi:hypothetical protein